MDNRICKTCLLREKQGEYGIDFVLKYTNVLKPEDKTDDDLYELRLEQCKCCDYLFEATCKACGCYVELRAASKNAHCPYKKW